MRNKGLIVFSLLGVVLVTGCAETYYNAATKQQETYLYSEAKESRIGASLARSVSREFKPHPDILAQQKIQSIGERLAAVSERKDITYSFVLLDNDEVNAFALPGGYIYMFRGLWDKIKEKDDAVAGVLAHEMAHVTARHSMKRLQNALGYNAMVILAATVPVAEAADRGQVIQGMSELMLSYSRQEENEADQLAVRYMQESGYDPQALFDVLAVLETTQRERPAGPPQVWTHPHISERRGAVREVISGGNKNFDDYINVGIDPGARL